MYVGLRTTKLIAMNALSKLIAGFLEWVEPKQFNSLQLRHYQSLYSFKYKHIDDEGNCRRRKAPIKDNYFILFGPLSLCNSCSHSTHEFWNFDVLGDPLVWKVDILAVKEHASSLTFNSIDKLSISDSQLNHSTGQNDPITTTSISDFHLKLNTYDCTTKLQLFAKVILHNPNSHTFNSYQYKEHEEIVLKYNLTDAPIFS